MADPDLSDALSNLEDGLELVLDRDGARWQHPARSHLFFEVDQGRAEMLIDALDDRFETRRQNGRLVLTPTPSREPVPENTDPTEVVLHRQWLRYRELVDAISHLGYKGVESFVSRHKDALRIRHVTGHGDNGLLPVVHADGALLNALETNYPELSVSIDIRHEERTLAPMAVELTEPWYTYYALAGLLQRDVEAVRYGLLDHRTHLAFAEKLIEGRQHRVVFSTPFLAEVIEDVWQANVTIAAGLRQGVAA